MSNDNKNSTASGAGIGFFGLLTIALIVLKLCKVIDWSWLWVLAPSWIPLAAVILIIAIIFIVAGIKSLKKD